MRAPLPFRRWLAPLVALALGLSRPASADEGDQGASAEADALFQRAGQAYDAGDFALARSLYARAFEKKKTHDIAAMMAQTEMKLGRPCEAEAHLEWAVANLPPSLADERRARLVRARAEVKKQIGALRVETTPAGAAVQVDHQPVPASALPGPFCVAAGSRTVHVSRDGFAVERRVVDVAPGAVVTVEAELRRIAVEDGPRIAGLPPPLVTYEPARVPPASPLTPLAFSGLFVGAFAIVAGGVVLQLGLEKQAAANNLYSSLLAKGTRHVCEAKTDHGADCGRFLSLRQDEYLLIPGGVASLLAGAALTAASGSLLLFRPPASGVRPGGPRVTATATPDGAFIALQGVF